MRPRVGDKRSTLAGLRSGGIGGAKRRDTLELCVKKGGIEGSHRQVLRPLVAQQALGSDFSLAFLVSAIAAVARRPPRRRPAAAPAPATVPDIANAVLRSLPWVNIAVSRASAAGLWTKLFRGQLEFPVLPITPRRL
jgi:hypothetical protein